MNDFAYSIENAPPKRCAAGQPISIGSLRFARGLEIASLAVALVLPLAVVPGLAQPFSRPKLIVWTAVVLLGFACYGRAVWTAWGSLPICVRIATAVWTGVLGCSAILGEFASLAALLLPLTGVAWFVLLISAKLRARKFSWALVASGTIVAALALTQFLGVDLFSATGWIPAASGNTRMHVFSTLGNPNFVAAFLAGLLPLTLSLTYQSKRLRWWPLVLSLLQLAAILATRSRAPILGLAVASLWIACFRTRRLLIICAAIVVCAIGLTASTSGTRDLATTLRGRLYIWKVSAPHLEEHLVLGLGPGGFAASFPAWETQYWRYRLPDDRDRNFAGIEDHAHNDYLETFADYGAVGLLGFLSVLILLLRGVVGQPGATLAAIPSGASSGVVALAFIALVDFPFERPADAFLFWSLMALCCSANTMPRESAASDED